MTDESGLVRRIVWREVFRWIVIFRTFRLAISPALLLLATLAALLAPLGWRVADYVFLEPAERAALHKSARLLPPEPGLAGHLPAALRQYLPHTPSGIVEAYCRLSEPVQRMFSWSLSLRQAAFYAFGNLWSLVIWAFVGGVITRQAVVLLGRDEPADIFESLRFACRRYVWYLLAPLYPLGGVLVAMLPLVVLGWVMRLDVGVVLAGLLWVLVIAISLVAVWLLLGLVFGWPLLWPAVSAERNGDAYEAFSRTFSYVYGRPLHLFFYIVVAALLGALGWAVVYLAIEMLISFGFTATSWGAGGNRVVEIQAHIASGDTTGPLGVGSYLIGLVIRLARLVQDGFSFSYFFCAAAAIYLLLRQDVDQTEFDEVYVAGDDLQFAGPVAAPGAASDDLPASPARSENEDATE
jgi:hypothetical protein